jgi:ankyrin repeat protein
MRTYFKFIVYLFVFIGYSGSFAGSYDDYFSAIGLDNADRVNALLQRGFDSNTVNPKGEHGLLFALRVPALKVAEVLIQHPATNVEVRTASDESPLMLAALRGYTDICIQLIAHDADVNKPGWAPLHYAATGAHLEVMRLLLESHAYIDAASPNGSTPLMMAAMYGNASAVKLLLEAGADSTLKNDLGLSALDFAQKAQKADSAEIIAAFIRAKAPKGAW